MTTERLKQTQERTKNQLILRDKLVSLGIVIPSVPEPLIPIETPHLETMPLSTNYPYAHLQATLQTLATDINPALKVGKPTTHVQADFSIPCYNTYPQSVAAALKGNSIPMVQAIDTSGNYVNMQLEPQSYGTAVVEQIESLGKHYGEQNIGNGGTVLLDVSSPNSAKLMSLGHLLSTVNGESLARIYKVCGYQAIRDNHVGDWGNQFGKLMLAYKLWGSETPELQSDPVKGLYKLYVRMNTAIREQKEEHKREQALKQIGEGVPLIQEGGLTKKQKKKQKQQEGDDYVTPFEQAGDEWFLKMEQGDTEALTLQKWAADLSMKEFAAVYALLGTKYEFILGESYYTSMDPQVVKACVNANLTQRDPKGGIVIDTQPELKDPKDSTSAGDQDRYFKVENKHGASVYGTRDLSTLIFRTEVFDPMKIVYVVGQEQRSYFRKLFVAFRLLLQSFGIDVGPEIEHVSFGQMSLVTGDGTVQKFATRSGNVIFLTDELQSSIQAARKIVTENMVKKQNKDETWSLSGEEIDTIARQVGVGAMIFSVLGQSRTRNIVYDQNKAVSLEGTTSASIQYAHARARSILRTAGEISTDRSGEMQFALPVEQDLVKALAQYPTAIAEALQASEPSIIAANLQTIVTLFNQFYYQTSIVKEPNEKKKQDRLRLTAATAQVIKNGLDLLCIEAPERM